MNRYPYHGLARKQLRRVIAEAGDFGSRLSRFMVRQRFFDLVPPGYFERRRGYAKRKWASLEAFQNRLFAVLIDSMEKGGEIDRYNNNHRTDCNWEVSLTRIGWALYERDEKRDKAAKEKMARLNTKPPKFPPGAFD